MITYLWTRNDGTYVGLNGHVYNEAPTTDEIIELQQYAQGFVNDQYAYGQAFATNVADKIGVDRDQYFAYYNTDDSCLPDICKVTANLAEDPSNPEPHVKSEIYTADTGCRVLDFTFYNIKGECECTIESSQIYVRYSRSDCFPDECMFPVPDGCDYMGLLITNNEEDSAIFSKYSWFKIGGLGDNATSYISYVFARSPRKPVTPSGGTYTTGLPTAPSGIWYDTVPGHNNYGIWMSKRVFWSDEITPENPSGKIEHTDLAWSDPVLMTDNKTFQSEWAAESNETNQVYINQNDPAHGPTLPSLNEARFQDPTNITEGINETLWRQAAAAAGCGNWSDNAAGATYLAWSNCRNGLWDNWTIAKIRGEGGKDGANAGRVFMIFCSLEKEDGNGQMVIPNRPEGGHWDMVNNILETNGVPPLTGTDTLGRSVAWSPDNARQDSGMCTWLSTGSFDGDTGNLIGQWSEPVCITGEDGIDGTDGENREYIYARFATLDDYMCYASDYSQTEDFECGDAYAECQEMLNTTADTAYQENDYIPTNPNWVYATWLDHPEGIEPDWRVEACCMRLKQEVDDPDNPGETISVWGPWIGPFIWASWGEDGIDGDGVEYIFCVTTNAETTTEPYFFYNPFTGDVGAYTDWASVLKVPSHVDASSAPHIVVGEGSDAKYYELTEGERTIFLYPGDLVIPPQNFCETGDNVNHPEKGCLPCVAEDGCNRCETSLYRTLCYGEANYDLKRAILWRYYQLPEFMPGDKVYDDLNDSTSPLRQIIAEEEEKAGVSLGNYEFITAWDGNWTDNPMDVGPQQPYEWVSVRKYKYGTHDTTKEWLPFSEPKLWANWAFDGTSTFTSMVFTRTNDNIKGMELCGGTFELPYPGVCSEDEPCPDCDLTKVKYDKYKERTEVKYVAPDSTVEKTYYWYDTVPSDMDYEYSNIERSLIPSDANIVEVTTWPTDVTEDDNEFPVYIRFRNPENEVSYYKKVASPRNTTIWMSMKVFGDELTGESQGWTAPRRMSDTSDFNVEWCLTPLKQSDIDTIKSDSYNFGKFVKMVEDDPALEDDDLHTVAEGLWEDALRENNLGEWSDMGDGAIYMATTTFRNGKWTNWTVSKIKGEKGDAGTSLHMLGSTKGVVKGITGLSDAAPYVDVGEILAVVCDSQRVPCINDPDVDIDDSKPVQFYQKTTSGWICLACETYYDYVPTYEGTFIVARDSGEYTTAVVNELPETSSVTSSSTEYLQVTGVTPNEFYVLTKLRLLTEGDTIVINGITDEKSSIQNATGEELRCGCSYPHCGDYSSAVENGDFFVWDTDSWRKTTNLMGPGSYLHVKYADEISWDGKYYRLTEPATGGDKHGEVPGKYIGMYVDNQKQDANGIEGDADYPFTGEHPAGTTITNYWSAASGPYKWSKYQGDDGLGYEYIYCLTTNNSETLPEDGYNGGKPYVPTFTSAFMNSSIYQHDGFVPDPTLHPELANDSWTDSTGQTYRVWTGYTKPDGYTWTDNSISPDTEKRYRWKCYRTKENGKWGPFIGDKSFTRGVLENGVYATFDANCSDELLVADFDMEFIPMYVDEDGKAIKAIETDAHAVDITSEAQLAQGSKDYVVTNVECLNEDLPNGLTATSKTVGDKIHARVIIDEGCQVGSSYVLTYKIEGHEEGSTVIKSAKKTLTIVGIKTDTLYYLRPSVKAIKKDGNGVPVEESVTCDVLKKVIGNPDIIEIPFNYLISSESEIDLMYSIDGGPFTNFSMPLTRYRELTQAKNYITINLYDENGYVLNASEQLFVYSDGTSLLKADLDNEQDSIPLSFDGVVESGTCVTVNYRNTEYCCVTASTTASLFYGSKRATITSLRASLTDADGDALSSTPIPIYMDGNEPVVFASMADFRDAYNNVTAETVTVYVRRGWVNFPDALRINLRLKGDASVVDDEYHNTVFTIAGVRAGAPGENAKLYNLWPVNSVIVKHHDGQKDPPLLTCAIKKREGDETTIVPSVEGLSIVYAVDDSEVYQAYDGGVDTSNVNKRVTLRLMKEGQETPVDIEKVPIVSDGEPGRGIIATCRYYRPSEYKDSADFSANMPPINDRGISTGWAMIGSYVDVDNSVNQVQHALPATDDEHPYLWMVEVTWYTGGDPNIYIGPPLLLSKDGVGISDCTNYFISAATEAYGTVSGWYNEVDRSGADPNTHFTTIVPEGDLDPGFTIWYFTIIYYTDGTRTCLPLCVYRDGSLLKDIEVLRGMFGEANVEGKRGAYLREFLGVMGDNTPLDNHNTQATETDFYNLNVKAFMNATSYWYDEKRDLNNEQKKRLMFASGISDLGGRNNSLNPPYNDNSDQIVIDDVVATLKIWESGFLECTCASVAGRIEATEGYFGGAKNVVIAEDGIVAYPVITLNTGKKAADYTAQPMFILGETGATFNGTVNANGGTIGCLIIKDDGSVEHTDTTIDGDKVFEINYEGRFSSNYSFVVGTDTYKRTVSSNCILYSKRDVLSTQSYAEFKEDSVTVQRGSTMTQSARQYELARMEPGSVSAIRMVSGTVIRSSHMTPDSVTSDKFSADTGFYQVSDARKKSNIVPLTNTLDTIDSIPTIYHNWKEGDTKTRHIGTLAQDLLPIYPEVVTGNEDEGYAVEYPKLSVIALAAIKELKAEVESLKEEIKKLKEEQNG